MSKEIPAPYVWTYQPQLGTAAGASQDYSTRLCWMSAGPKTINRVNSLNEERNRILMRQAQLTETPRYLLNPPSWPNNLIKQPTVTSTIVPFPRNELAELQATNEGFQLAGGKFPLKTSLKQTPFIGRGLQLAEPFGRIPLHAAEGTFQLTGGEIPSYEEIILTNEPSQPRSGGIGSIQFTEEFVPSVYINPFSGPPSTYPNQFIYNYNVENHGVDGYS